MQGYLSKKGYILKKENITNEELLQIKSDLTAKPLTDEKYYKINNDYPIYSETKNNIIIPKSGSKKQPINFENSKTYARTGECLFYIFQALFYWIKKCSIL